MIPVKAISPTDVAQALLAAWNPSVAGVTVPVGGRKYDVTAPTERVVLDKD